MVLFIGTMLCSNSSEFIIQAIAIKIQSIPVFWCRIFAEHAWQQSLKTGNFFARFYFPLFSAYRGTFLGKKTSCTDWGGQPMQEVYRFGHRLFIGSKVCFYHFTAIKGGIYRRKRSAQISQFFKVIPHNSKCRYGERGAAAAKPKAQIILDVLSSILATQMPCRSRRSGA